MTAGHLPGIFDTSAPLRKNHLYYGDNLTIMRSMPTACVDLIYLDPPFNSQRNYNLIYKKLTGQPVPEQEEAFCDAWDMDPEKEEMARNMPVVLREYGADDDLVRFWSAWIAALRNTQPRLLAYLIYMSYRLFEMRRILKPNGSIYLHCDPTASHYIKVIMDGVFGHQKFRNEIIWKRTGAHSGARRYGPVHDVILYYANGDKTIWNPQFLPHDQSYIQSKFGKRDKHGHSFQDVSLTGPGLRTGPSGQPWRGFDPSVSGRHWQPASYLYKKYRELTGEELNQYSLLERLDKLDDVGLIYWPGSKDGFPRYRQYLSDAAGSPLQDVWTDIKAINSQAAERLGYPTQKPIELLKRIIESSSKPGDVVFDPFCGCGSAVYASHLTNRKWIGCDIAILSVRLVRDVLLRRYGLNEGVDYDVSGSPLSVEGAEELFNHDPRQFQHWSVELAGGFASTKHSGDQGIDGRIHYETAGGLRNMVLSVKGGKLAPAFMRELRGTLEREGDTEQGGMICLQPPTRGMLEEAAKAGIYHYDGKDYHRLQIRTIDELLAGKAFDTPSRVRPLTWQKQIAMPI